MSFLDRLRFRPRRGPLGPDGLLASDLWLDQPDAHRRIARRLRRGEIDAQQAESLRHFTDRGYLIFSPGFDPATYAAFDDAVERLWLDRPDDVAYAYHSPLTRFSDARPEHRRPSYRIADLHTFCDAALALYLDRRIFDVLELIFGEPAVATQSLYFEWGSQQSLHRDPMHVWMEPPSHLLAAWMALEDIGPHCGPLTYVPGSHRLPYYQFEPGRFVVYNTRDGPEDLAAAASWDRERCAAAGLRPEILTCRRGDILIWHHSLLHGGSPPENPLLTRKSFVVHYTTSATMKRVENGYLDPPAEDCRYLVSERLLRRDGCRGFDSSLHVEAVRRREEKETAC